MSAGAVQAGRARGRGGEASTRAKVRVHAPETETPNLPHNTSTLPTSCAPLPHQTAWIVGRIEMSPTWSSSGQNRQQFGRSRPRIRECVCPIPDRWSPKQSGQTSDKSSRYQPEIGRALPTSGRRRPVARGPHLIGNAPEAPQSSSMSDQFKASFPRTRAKPPRIGSKSDQLLP